MIQAIFYKEWIKTRWYWLLATLFMIGITGYSMLRIGRTIAIQGIDHLWVVMVQKDAIFIDLLQFVPLLIGILLAAVQFFPEMQRKCLKLTLHLPYSQKKMVMSMLAYGVLALVTCFAMSFIMMGVYLPQHFTSELVQRVLLSAAPEVRRTTGFGICPFLLTAFIPSVPGTHMEAQGFESDYCGIDFPCLLSGSGSGGI